MTEFDPMQARMVLGTMMARDFEENPPDLNEWIRILEGCAELFQYAAQALGKDPAQYADAARCIALAVEAGSRLHPDIAIAYALSGQATDDMLENLRSGLEDQ